MGAVGGGDAARAGASSCTAAVDLRCLGL
jgi:hypothetical protein